MTNTQGTSPSRRALRSPKPRRSGQARAEERAAFAFLSSWLIGLVVFLAAPPTWSPFARLRFRGRHVLFALLIGTLLLPGPVLLIPQFLLFKNFGWYGTYLPLTVPSFAGNAFFIFLLRQCMRCIPRELDEAARLDGAGHWTIYRRIILPLSAPALTVVAVFMFLGTWNDFFGPLIYLDDPDRFQLAVALATNYSKVGTHWNTLMAANLSSIIPPLVVYFPCVTIRACGC
ncbi:MAG: carbohydrate ABC transporter permease [Candidatus Dormibacteraeota bacterium]|nr:carbohydrate ABC transporter permease [Candidatus Dormibacteraeota bacterium]